MGNFETEPVLDTLVQSMAALDPKGLYHSIGHHVCKLLFIPVEGDVNCKLVLGHFWVRFYNVF